MPCINPARAPSTEGPDSRNGVERLDSKVQANTLDKVLTILKKDIFLY